MQRQFVLRIRCQDLDSSSISGDLNPQVIVSEQSGVLWVEKGRTEVAFKTKQPQFSHPIQINYEFQESFKVKFDVYCCQGEAKHPIGSTSANITTLLAAKDQIYYTDLSNKHNNVGKIVIIGEYQIYKNDLLEMNISANDLIKGNFLCWKQMPRNPFIKIFRAVQDSQEATIVYQSPSIQYPNQRHWPTIKKYAKEVCNHDYDTALQFEICDKSGNNQALHIGQVNVSINQITDQTNARNIINANTRIQAGSIKFDRCKLYEVATFEQYITGGLQLNLMISIDFTDSNLEPSNPQSLHHFDYSGNKLSQYETALRYISEILIQYDHDKSVPLYGFGFVNQNSQTQHCYPMNHNYEDPEVKGLIGIFQTYREFVRTIKFAGPTLFRPTLNVAKKIAQGFKDAGSDNYVVLTILTDGLISDFEGSFEMIVDCCELPISIIIIGIGDADFSLMERLNNDNLEEVDSQGRQATRDLVKFVAFNNFQKDPKRLAREVLSELPDQVVNYMQVIGKQPGNAPNFGGQLPNMRQSEQLQELQRYYQPNKLKRQNTLQKFLGESEVQDEDEKTLITKHPIQMSQQSQQQFQQQQQQLTHIQNPLYNQNIDQQNQIGMQDIQLEKFKSNSQMSEAQDQNNHLQQLQFLPQQEQSILIQQDYKQQQYQIQQGKMNDEQSQQLSQNIGDQGVGSQCFQSQFSQLQLNSRFQPTH